MPRKKDNRITLKMRIKKYILRICAKGNTAIKATVLIVLIFGSIIMMIAAPQHRNDIIYFYCLLVALATFFISYLIHLQAMSRS